jgi:hypothetical protein
MSQTLTSRAIHATGLMIAMALGVAAPSKAADPPVVIDWIQGAACRDFPLRVELYIGSSHLTFKTFNDKNGNLVRILLAGQNFPMRFINMTTQASYDVKAEGAVQNVKLNPNGSTTLVLTGHTVVTWTPPDPPAPATIRYVGRLVFTVDSSGSTISAPSFTGQKTDICAALS